MRVSVLDKNDSPPSFGESPLRYTVSEDMLAGRRIATLRATDPDTLGTLTYSLVDGDDNKFTLDAASGHLSLQDTLDRETKSQYHLTVRADDGQQHTDTTIYIEVGTLSSYTLLYHYTGPSCITTLVPLHPLVSQHWSLYKTMIINLSTGIASHI